MTMPFNMTAPNLKLSDGEQLVAKFPALRKKGIFGNCYGEIVITNQRVAFVKAIMKSGLISAAVNKIGAKPMLEFSLKVKAEKIPFKKTYLVQLTDNGASEKFMASEEAADGVIASTNTAS
jgi:hypothetical protein